MREAAAEFGVGREFDVEIALDLARFLTQFLPTRFLQLQIRIPHLDLSQGADFGYFGSESQLLEFVSVREEQRQGEKRRTKKRAE